MNCSSTPVGLHPIIRLATAETSATHGQRAASLQAQAKTEANANLGVFVAHLAEMASMAAEIADGGDIYAAGVREEARQAAESIAKSAQRIEAIRGRS